MINNYVFFHNISELDLHELDRFEASIKINEFIADNYMLREKYLRIIHGKGAGILKKTTHELLKKNKYVEDYKIDSYNAGCTIVLLKEHHK